MMLPLPKSAFRRIAPQQRAVQPRVVEIPAPTGGLNARDALSGMDTTDAVQMDNWYPDFGKVTMRRGYVEHATTLGGEVETLAVWESGGAAKLLAGADGEIWDISTPGAGSSLKSGFTSDRWQTAQMGAVLGLVNGADTPQQYDGTSVTDMSVSGSGLTAADLIGINVFKSRSYFWEVDSPSFWYSATSALGGALTEFPLGLVGTRGGDLVAMITWTRDGGAGIDDLAVFVMSSGETIVFQGSDPGDPNDWALVGVFSLGAPVNVRAVCKVGGDALIVTSDGYVMLSAALGADRTSPRARVSDKIVNDALKQVAATGSEFGWQALHYPAGTRVMINFPTESAGVFQQHVVNLQTGAWTRFKGMDARCWAIFDDQPYFGGDETVFRADTGNSDNGEDIEIDAVQAFSYLGQKGRRKQVTMARPLLEASGSVPLRFTLETDFVVGLLSIAEIELGSGAGGAVWDDAEWDLADWAGGLESISTALVRGDIADAFAPRMRIKTQDREIAWASTQLVFVPAGLL